MQEVSNPIQAVTDIFYKPNQVFRKLAETNNWSWVPFFLIVLLAVLPLYVYFDTVDFEYYTDFLVNTTAADKSPAEQDQFRAQLSQGFVKWSSTIAVFVGIIVVNALMALYYTLVTKNDEKCVQGYMDWYGFCWWVSLPGIFSSLIALVLLLTASTNQMDPSIISPLSLSALLSMDPTSDFAGIAGSIRLDMFWSLYLAAVGISQWTGFSNRGAWIAAAAPYIVIYAVWLVIALI